MTKCKLMKGLLGATALTVLSTGTAFAQVDNEFTEAGETVSNTFTLDYKVNNTTQPQLNNTATPTEFNVDNLVNVTVSSLGDTNVVTDQDDALLPFVIVNNGNDDQAYTLGIEQATGDNFDSTTATTAPDFIFYVDSDDTDGDGVLDAGERAAATPRDYNTTPGSVSIPELAPDDRAFVFVRQNIPAGLADTNQAGVILYAETQVIDSGTGIGLVFSPIVGDTDGNNANPLTVENVFADEDGPAAPGNDADEDGAHSALGNYIIQSPNVTASKLVFGIASASAGTCNAVPPSYTETTANSEYFTPNSCVEYIIKVENSGATAATEIDLTDILPEHLTFREAAVRGDLVLPVTAPVGNLATPGAGTPCDGTVTSACTVALTNATLAAGGTGFLVIRATID